MGLLYACRKVFLLLAFACWAVVAQAAQANDPLPRRIDQLILADANGNQPNPTASDAEFLRRVYLDLAGRIPRLDEARQFLDDPAADKRAKLIDKLLASDDYPRRMAQWFHMAFMERRGSDAAWFKYLHQAFAENRPWDQLAREILNPNANEGDAKAAAYFYIKRLDKVGQNLTDYPGVTRDVGRLFLGMDLQCAQCHNHLFIDDYKQADFQGLFVVYQNTFLRNDVKPTVIGENLLKEKVEFSSVFDKVKHTVGVRIPGVGEVPMPRFAAGEEYVQPPDKKTRFPGIPKFSPLAEVANRLPTAENRPFARNFVNRLWFMMMGRGLVQPLDQHHSANPPSHPAVLDLLTDEFIAHKFDIRWLLGELAKSETYQRASELPTTGQAPPADRFLMAAERRLSAEQLMYSVLTATETRVPEAGAKLDALESRFVKALANPPLEPEEEFAPSLQSALFLLHDSAVLECVSAKNDNVVKRLAEVKDNNQVVDEVYLAVLTRKPVDEERAAADKFLTAAADQRPDAIGQLVWALLASTEFMVNH